MKLGFVVVCMLGVCIARADVYYDFETPATSPFWLGTTQLVQNTSASHQGTNAIGFTGGYPNNYVLTELPQGTRYVEFHFYDEYGPNPPLYRYLFFRLLDTNSTAFASFAMLDGGWGTTPPMTSNHYYAFGNAEYSARTMGPLRTVGWTNTVSTNTWTNWTATVNLTPGTNVVKAYALDTAGNKSTTNTVSFSYVVTNRLVVRATGQGTLSPNYSNTVLEIGRSYSMTASGVNGHVFTNWVISTNWIGGVTNASATLNFLMQSNLTLQVNFADVTKPTVAITSPTANQRFSNSVWTVKGTASDNARVSGVWYQLNGATWNPAWSTNGWTNWTAMVGLIKGTNLCKVYAVDTSGNKSLTNSVSFVASNAFQMRLSFSSAHPLTTNGLELRLDVSPGLNGRIEVSTNLANWTSLTNFIGTNSTLHFRDAAATNLHYRFYRAIGP